MKQKISSGGNEKLYAQVGAVTWNTAALFHSATIQRQARRKVIKQLCKEFKIVALQETHGNPHDLEEFAKLHPRFLLYGTFCGANLSMGGCILMVAKSLAQSSLDIMPQVIAEGRSIRRNSPSKRRSLT